MTIEELKDLNEKIGRVLRRIDYHADQAENFKKLYELTQNRKGVYRLLKIFARKRNQYHCQTGINLANSQIESISKVLKELEELNTKKS